MIRLTKTGFRQWLVKNKKVIVGKPDKPMDCPFCRFLKSKGAKEVRVPDIRYRVVDGQIHEHNLWQRVFQIKAINMETELGVIGLRGREALQVLDEL